MHPRQVGRFFETRRIFVEGIAQEGLPANLVGQLNSAKPRWIRSGGSPPPISPRLRLDFGSQEITEAAENKRVKKDIAQLVCLCDLLWLIFSAPSCGPSPATP